MSDIRSVQEAVHALARKNGWWDDAETTIVPEKIALIHAELSEALEEYRDGNMHLYYQIPGDISTKPEGFGIELADAIIRILDLADWLGIDINDMINIKHRYNVTRPYRHGGKIA